MLFYEALNKRIADLNLIDSLLSLVFFLSLDRETQEPSQGFCSLRVSTNCFIINVFIMMPVLHVYHKNQYNHLSSALNVCKNGVNQRWSIFDLLHKQIKMISLHNKTNTKKKRKKIFSLIDFFVSVHATCITSLQGCVGFFWLGVGVFGFLNLFFFGGGGWRLEMCQ